MVPARGRQESLIKRQRTPVPNRLVEIDVEQEWCVKMC